MEFDSFDKNTTTRPINSIYLIISTNMDEIMTSKSFAIGIFGIIILALFLNFITVTGQAVKYNQAKIQVHAWGQDIRLTIDPRNSLQPTAERDSNTLYVAWGDDRTGNYQIYFKKSTDS